MGEKSSIGPPVKEKKGKVVTLKMSLEEAKSTYLQKYPLRLTELWRENREENSMLIMDQESAETYKFNISALEMWKMCSGDHTVEGIVEHICDTMENAPYDAVLQDTLGFLMTLEKLGLLGWKDD